MGLISWRKDGWTEHIRFEICIEKWSICFASLFGTICDGVLRQVNWNQLFKSCLKIYLFLYWYYQFDWLFFFFFLQHTSVITLKFCFMWMKPSLKFRCVTRWMRARGHSPKKFKNPIWFSNFHAFFFLFTLPPKKFWLLHNGPSKANFLVPLYWNWVFNRSDHMLK